MDTTTNQPRTLLGQIEHELTDWRYFRAKVLAGEEISEDRRKLADGSLKVAGIYGRAGATIANQWALLLAGARLSGMSGADFTPVVRGLAATLGVSDVFEPTITAKRGPRFRRRALARRKRA